MDKAILITGCSSGIGRSAAEYLLKSGYTVIATARKVETLDALKQDGAVTLPLDVTNQASIDAVTDEIKKAGYRLYGLINNAGYGQMGPFEEVTYEQSYTQMNTNVLGLASVTRAVLPILRENGGGRIINVSSIAGKVALPLSGWYCASKFAVEALSDTMRLELRQFGIKVVVIEPGPIRTNFGEVAYATADNVKPDSLYKPLLDRMKSWTKSTLNDNVAGKTDDVSKVILKALEKKNPRPRYRITGIAKFLYCVRRMSSDRLLDLIFRKQMGLK